MKLKITLTLISIIIAAAVVNPVSAAGSGTPDNAAEDKIDKYITREMKVGKIPGLSLAVVQGNNYIYMKGYGIGGTSKPQVTPQTPFIIGSVSKTFTALAIRQLVNEGKVDYEAPVRKYIQWFTLADPEAAKKIKVIDLVRHTSGLSTLSGSATYLYSSKYSLEELVRKMSKVQPDRPVDISEEYSNLNYLILGLVVEKASGMSYENYIESQIFSKMDMRHSFVSEAEARKYGLAQGHTIVFGLAVPTGIPFPQGHVSAGFLISSAEDMAHYASAYLKNGYYNDQSVILNNELPALVELSVADKSDNKWYDSYWMPQTGSAKGALGYEGHVGSTSSYTSVMLMNPELRTAIVVLTNSLNESISPQITAQTIGNGIASILKTGNIPYETKTNIELTYVLSAMAIIIFAVIRLFWTKRFKHNITGHKFKKMISFTLYALVDLLLPVYFLFIVPLTLDCTWFYLLNSNPKLWYPILPVMIILLTDFIWKSIILVNMKGRKTLSSAS